MRFIDDIFHESVGWFIYRNQMLKATHISPREPITWPTHDSIPQLNIMLLLSSSQYVDLFQGIRASI